MMNRNTKQSIQADIQHLEKMMSLLETITENSSHDSATAEYLRRCIIDWIDELKKIKPSNHV